MESTKIKYVHGDATKPEGDGLKVIAHICNDAGGWGAGFVLALSKMWPGPEKAYREWAIDQQERMLLGKTQFVRVEDEIWVCNMIGQTGYGFRTNQNVIFGEQPKPPIRYDALIDCLQDLVKFCKRTGASVHMPRIGSKLAGGRWEIIEQIIETVICENEIPVTVYLLEDDPKHIARRFDLNQIATSFRAGIEHGVDSNKPNTTEYIKSIL